MSLSNELHHHYALLLGINSPWKVNEVELSLELNKVEVRLGLEANANVACPACGQACTVYDLGEERTWRHLDTMQFATLVRARIPRADCPEHGAKTIRVPWAEPSSRFTLLFERFAVDVLLACSSIKQACALLQIGWDTGQEIMRRAVERGLLVRDLESIRYVGIDEKSFRRGQSYITLMTDVQGHRVLEVQPERDTKAACTIW
jgi:transposase